MGFKAEEVHSMFESRNDMELNEMTFRMLKGISENPEEQFCFKALYKYTLFKPMMDKLGYDPETDGGVYIEPVKEKVKWYKKRRGQ